MEIRTDTGLRPGFCGSTCAALMMWAAISSATDAVGVAADMVRQDLGDGRPAMASVSRNQESPAQVSQSALSYEALIARLDRLPITREADALYDAAVGRAVQAGARLNPAVAFDAENAFGTGAFTAYRRAVTTVSISQPVELWGQRGARIDAARATVDVVGLRRDQTRLLAAGRLAQAYAQAEAAARQYDLAQEALTLAAADATAARALIAEGREPALRGVQADSDVQAARAIVAAAHATRTAAFAWLTAVARLDETPGSIPPSLLDRTPRRAPSSLEVPLSVRLAEAEYRIAERLVAVEQLRARPALSATLGVQRLDETEDVALAFGVSVALPLFDRNRGAIAAAGADQRAAEARRASARDEAIAHRRAAEANIDASAIQTQAADSAVAAADDAYRLARIGFEAGRISQLELRATRVVLVGARNAAVDARLARVSAEIELARLEGRVPFGERR